MRVGRLAVLGAALLALGTGAASHLASQAKPPSPALAKTLRPAASFANIADARTRSVALLREAGKVLLHPRCTNCHTSTEQPFQGDRQQLHRSLVVRGRDNKGVPGMPCTSCHGTANFDPARVPGAPNWQLAPPVTGWQGRTLGVICRQIKNPRLNGGKDLAGILKHLATDGLVIWAWNPGADRTAAPGSHPVFVELMTAWVATGGHCPPL